MMSWLTRLSLANRSVVALAAITLILLGSFVIPQLKQELFPASLSTPTISILTAYSGATPAQVEQDVTKPLEQHLSGLPGMQNTSSTSSGGLSLIVVTYSFGTNLDSAQQRLTEQVNRVQPLLPSNVQPQVQAFDINAYPIIDLSVTSAQDPQDLAVALQQDVVPVVQSIGGVASVNITGVRQPIVKVDLNVQKLQDMGLTILQVQNSLQANNMTIPAGEVSTNSKTFSVRVGNAFVILQAVQDLIVGTRSSNQAPIKLSDIATIQQVLAPSSTLTRINGQPGLGISVTKTPDGNTVAISQALRAQLSNFEHKAGHGAHIAIVDDQAPLISSTIGELTTEGALGAGFAILVILVFLLSIRSTLVTAIAIPLSVLIALIALWIQGYSLNALTLSGLTVAIGRVVDDAIVVLENIYRHLGTQRDKRNDILLGVKEVAGAVTASTLTTVAVFLPLALVGGTVGQQAAPLALAVTIALLASLLVALTVIPVLAYWFLKPQQRLQNGISEQIKLNLFERCYIPLIHWVMRYRAITILLAICVLLGSFALFPLIPTSFINPTLTPNSFALTQELPAGTSLEQTNQAAHKIEGVLSSIQGIKLYQATIGTSNAGSSASSGANIASFIINTIPAADTKAVEQNVHRRLNVLSDVGTITYQDQSNNIVDLTVQSSNVETLNQATRRVLDILKMTPHAVAIRSNLDETVPLIDVHVDPSEAALHGLTGLQVGQALLVTYTGVPVTRVTIQGVQQEIELGLLTSADSAQQISDMLIAAPTGNVRLGDIATVTQIDGPVQIVHANGMRSATITLTPTDASYYNAVLSSVQQHIANLKLPGDATVVPGISATAAQDSINRLILALLLAIPTIFIVLVITFRSLIQPLILLVSIPFAAVGALILSAITRTPISSSSLFGFLMLIGIVVTNAIVLIDRVNHYRMEGMDARSAVIAGGQRRVRPILMTAVVTIIALLPLAMSTSGNAIVSSSLAIVVIGGLATSTLLTLLLVPTLYVLVEDVRERFKPVPDVSAQTTTQQQVLSQEHAF